MDGSCGARVAGSGVPELSNPQALWASGGPRRVSPALWHYSLKSWQRPALVFRHAETLPAFYDGLLFHDWADLGWRAAAALPAGLLPLWEGSALEERERSACVRRKRSLSRLWDLSEYAAQPVWWGRRKRQDGLCTSATQLEGARRTQVKIFQIPDLIPH